MKRSEFRIETTSCNQPMRSNLNAKVLTVCMVLIIVVCSLTPTAPVNALQVTGLYSHRIAVANESEPERNRAFREALVAVITKVTGSSKWQEIPAIELALGRAQSYVEAVSYASELQPAPNTSATDFGTTTRTPAGAPAIEQRYVNVTFAQERINELLITANIPIWDSNRPSVLVWMVLQDVNGERRLLTTEADPQIVDLIRRFAEERGVPVIFPVLDFEDRRNLPVESLWNLDETAIVGASVRYGADSVLSGRLLFAATGELVGLWQFIFQDQATIFDGLESDLQTYLHKPLERVTEQLSSYYAIVPVDSNEATVRLRIEGIENLQAYAALLNYVRNLGLVRSVSITSLDGTQLELDLGLQGDAQQLQEVIALDRDLLPIASSQGDEASYLHFRWTR